MAHNQPIPFELNSKGLLVDAFGEQVIIEAGVDADNKTAVANQQVIAGAFKRVAQLERELEDKNQEIEAVREECEKELQALYDELHSLETRYDDLAAEARRMGAAA